MNINAADNIINNYKYDNSKKYWNEKSKEVILEEANHSKYGNYCEQKGDINLK